MSKQTSSPEKTATKQQTKPQPTVEPLAGMAEFAGVSLLFGGKNVRTTQLGDPRFSALQRQLLAGQMGNAHGNGHLRQTMVLLKRDESYAPYQQNTYPKPASSVFVQPQLAIGPVNDPYEQEADRVADQVMARLATAPTVNTMMRRDKQEDELSMKPLITSFQQQAIQPEATVDETVEHAIQTKRRNGQPLDDDVRAPMEQAFGANFSGVHVHTDSESNTLNQQVQARAFTTGQDIFFRQGEYRPRSAAGKELIAHELTHVVQQQPIPILRQSNELITASKQKWLDHEMPRVAPRFGKPSTTRIQRAVKDEERKYPVEYNKATGTNTSEWYNKYKFINIFVNVSWNGNTGIFPGSTPIAYANHVYELQLSLKSKFAKYDGVTNGILDDTTINWAHTLAQFYKNKEKDPIAAAGVDVAILERLLHIKSREIKSPKPLLTPFGHYVQYQMIAQNSTFVVSRGDKGSHVEFLKQVLQELQYLLEDPYADSTDIYDESTVIAIKKFQEDAGMDVIDGNVGFGTLHLLDLKLSDYGSVVKTPGTESYRIGNLSEELKLWVDGDGDQKKELLFSFGRSDKKLSVKVKHADTGETKGPFLFELPELDLTKDISIVQSQYTEGLRQSEITLSNQEATQVKLALSPPTVPGGSEYHLNNERMQFDASKTRPVKTTAYVEDVAMKGVPAITAVMGPFEDRFRIFFDPTEEMNQKPPYEASLHVMGVSEQNVAFKDPLKVKLDAANRTVKVLQNSLNSLVLDLDNDGLADVSVYSQVIQRKRDQSPKELHNIILTFTGKALLKNQEIGFGVRNGAYIITLEKSEKGFQQYTTGLGPQQLAATTPPVSANAEIIAIDQTLVQYQLKALKEDAIKGDTLAAWWETERSLKFILENLIGKSTFTPEEAALISKAADAADKYQRLIQRDAGDKKSSQNISATEYGTTDVTENPYTRESVTTTTGPAYYNEDKTEIKLGEKIRTKNWTEARRSLAELADGFNQWVGDRLQEKLPDDKEIARYVKGISAMGLGLHKLSHNADVKHLTRLKAVYYSYEQFLRTKPDEAPPKIDLPLYYYYDVKAKEWCIVDYIQPQKPYRSTLDGDGDKAYPPQAALDKELNSKRHLPKGVLWYNHPDGSFNGKVQLTEPWEWSEILGWISAGLAGLGLAGAIVFSGGAATPLVVQVIFAASAVAGVASAGMDMYENAKHGTLTPTVMLLDIGAIAANLLTLGAAAGKVTVGLASKAAQSGTPWVGSMAKVAAMADASYVPLTASAIGVDSFNVAVLAGSSLEQMKEIESGPGDEASRQKAKILLLSNLIANGGLFVLSVKGNMSAFAGEKNIHLYAGKNGTTYALDSQSFQHLKEFNEKVPEEFAAAMHTLGKDEIQIAKGFAQDKEIRGDFYQMIDDYLKNHNKYKLSRDEAFAIWGYTSKFYYADLNKMLRDAAKPELSGPMADLLSSALKKLPNYSEKYAYRGIQISPDNIIDFKAKHQVGATLDWRDFSSAGGSTEASFAVKGNRNVVFEIEQKTAKDITKLADGTNFGKMSKPELLFDKGLKLTVVSVQEQGDRLVIKVREN